MKLSFLQTLLTDIQDILGMLVDDELGSKREDDSIPVKRT